MLKKRPAHPAGIFLRVFFRLLYHEFAWAYDIVAALVSLGRWKSWVFAALPYLHGQRILELGHGPGHLQLALASRGIEIYGIDESTQMNRITFDRLSRNNHSPRLVNAYAQFAPFAASAFDQVVATFPTEFLYESQTLHEIKRLLRPGGELLLIPLAWITGKSVPERLAAWLFRFTGQAPAELDDSTLQRLVRPLRSSGFQVEERRVNLVTSHVLLLLARPIPPPSGIDLQ